jgi:signal transduction histidine kinase
MDDNKRQERVSQAAQTALNLSHGVKNILQAIRGGRDVVDQCLKTNDIARAKRGWEILGENLDKIEKLVLDMLQFSKDSKLDIKRSDFNAVVKSAADSLRAGAQEDGKQITVSVDKDIKPVWIDADRMYDVILNLVLNAVHAVPKRTGVVEIATEAKGQAVILSVSDNGPGVEDTESIFEPFHTTKAKVGTGLGLPIARKIVTQHAGTIEVKSERGKGAVFIVTLPAKAHK